MNLRKFVFFIVLICLLFYIFNSRILAQNSSVFLNIGGLFKGTIIIGYSYYFSPNLALRGSLEFLSVSSSEYSATASLLLIGVQYFFDYYKGFFLIGEFGLGTINIEGYSAAATLFKAIAGYRFLFDSFFIDPGIGFGAISTSIGSFSQTGIFLEMGFLF
ncbi:MAG TPA: hypothetical protein PLF21_07460 [Exilispira sp.]|nr:hypothetical protein [Exilispira sp.]